MLYTSHESKTADDVRNRVFQAERQRDAGDAQGGDQRRGLHAEHWFEHNEQPEKPNEDACAIDEDRRAGNVGLVECLSQGLAYDSLGHPRDGDGDYEEDDAAEVVGEPRIGDVRVGDDGVCGVPAADISGISGGARWCFM